MSTTRAPASRPATARRRRRALPAALVAAALALAPAPALADPTPEAGTVDVAEPADVVPGDVTAVTPVETPAAETPAETPAEAPVAAALAEDAVVVPPAAYTIIGFSSESPPYPAPPAVDGTAAAILTDDMSEAWTVAYTVVDGAGVADDDFPHWIALDTGGLRDLAGVQYAMKPGIGQAKGYRVLVADDAAVAGDPGAAAGWTEVAVGELANAPGTTQTVAFDDLVRGRYLKIEFTDSTHAGGVIAASLIRALAVGDVIEPEPEYIEQVVPGSAYTILGFSSESPPYPAPPAVDGTAAAILTDDMSEAWTVAYTVVDGAGVADDDFPHWIAFDTGSSRLVTAVQYAMKSGIGHVTGYNVYLTDDPAVQDAPENAALWGDPVHTGTFPVAAGQIQRGDLAEPASGRYVKFEVTATSHAGKVAAASLIRVIELVEEGTEEPDEITPVEITAGDLTVTVAEEFPQVVSYELGGATLAGQARLLDSFTINGTVRKATTTFQGVTGTTARWTSVVADLENLEIDSSITLDAAGTVRFRIDAVTGVAEPTVNTLAIPGHSLVSIDSADPAAELARTLISTDSTTTADRFVKITPTTATDAAVVVSPYAIVTGSGLSAGLYSNATEDLNQSNSAQTNRRLATQITALDDGGRRAEVRAGAWTWAPRTPADVPVADARVARYENPEAVVVVTGDRNGNGVDWQDAGLALREVVPVPLGAERVPERVVQRIPFNIVSEATNHFHKTLDNTQRLALATDNLGQWALLKGYTSEGHDSANTDYGGHYNERTGGLEALNELIETAGERYNADFGVHVNATEVYPQANTFSDRIIAGQGLGWGWMNQAYGIDQRWDLTTGYVLDRFAQLRDEVPALDSLYIDVYYSSGWLAEALAAYIQDELGFELTTEWGYTFEGDSIWSHWANDKSYGGATNKGINSNIVRFISNTHRDVWNYDSLLGGVNMLDFEGWSAKDNFTNYYRSLWYYNLPTKFVQHFEILQWVLNDHALLDGDVEIRLVDGDRVVTVDGVEVLRSNPANQSSITRIHYLLPWSEPGEDGTSDPLDADKMYLFSSTTGERTYELTDAFAGVTQFEQFALTDNGRVKVADVTATDGAITFATVVADQPYVVVPAGQDAPVPAADWGQFTGIDDPGFNAQDLERWNATGAAVPFTTTKGDPVARFGNAASSISQEITGLEAGERYAFGAWVEIGPNRTRPVTMSVAGETVLAERTFETTPAYNWVGSDTKSQSYMQRVTVEFVAPEDGVVTIAFAAPEVTSTANVTIDDVWVTKIVPFSSGFEPGTPGVGEPTDVPEGALFWDFEDNQPGWGPFVRGGASGRGDAQTSISRIHEPFSQQSWKNAHIPFLTGNAAGKAIDDVLSGRMSLKSHAESNGLIYRTIPARVDFEPGHAYEVSFDYQVGLTGTYEWIVGADTITGSGNTPSSVVISRDLLTEQHSTARYSQRIVAGCGVNWVGLNKLSGSTGADFVIDNFMVVDLGPTEDVLPCASVTGAAQGEFNRGTTNRVTTTFTNSESVPVQNVWMTLDLPEGWTAQTVAENGNLFAAPVAPGQTRATTWLVTPPADTEPGAVEIGALASYEKVVGAEECVALEVTSRIFGSVNDRPTVPLSAITPTASSVQAGGSVEGPVRLAFDGDASTFWHTSWTPTAFPHWVRMDLGSEFVIDGFGYQNRPSGPNGRVKDYEIQISENGSDWTTVHSGEMSSASQAMQVVDLDEVTTRWVRFLVNGSHNGQLFASAAELRVYGVGGSAEPGFEPAPAPALTCEDLIAPTVTLTVDPALVAGWAPGGVEVTATATDLVTQDPDIEYRIDEGEWAAYTGPIVLETEGTYVVAARATDEAGNVSTVVSRTVRVDTTGPEITLALTEDREVQVTATDAGSGLGSVEYRLGDGEWAAYAAPIAVGEDAVTVAVRATDRVGNVSEDAIDVRSADEVAPQVTVSVDSELVGGWAAAGVVVTVTATDDKDPEPAVEYRIGDGEWGPYLGPVTFTADGTYVLQARATDAAGNVSDVESVTVKVDATAPELTVEVTEDRVLVAEATDTGSGLAALEYRLDDGAWTGYTTAVALGDDAVTVTVRATDRVGNVSTETIDVPEYVEPVPMFPDVPLDHPFVAEIEWLADRGITGGYEDGNFRPNGVVSRQAMAAFLYRYAEADFTAPATATFSDVPTAHPFFTEIEWAAAEGIVTGYEDGTFGPGLAVSRQATAAFLHRMAGEPAAEASGTFSDVPTTHPFAGAIEWLAEAGIAEGYSDGTFGPGNRVSRQAMAAYLYRLDQLG